MDLILITLIVVLLAINILVIFFLIRNKQQKTEDPTLAFKNEFNSYLDEKNLDPIIFGVHYKKFAITTRGN